MKLTVSNHNYGSNYSDWNVLIQHPGFSQLLQSFTFNSTTIHSVADTGKLYVGCKLYKVSIKEESCVRLLLKEIACENIEYCYFYEYQ